MNLAFQKCSHHPGREAVARCPECARFYCRECVTEHDDRIVCASCLKKVCNPGENSARSWQIGTRMLQAGAGIFVAWFFFYLIGQTLLRIPHSFHEGTVWKTLHHEME
jgi:hypothetical protein